MTHRIPWPRWGATAGHQRGTGPLAAAYASIRRIVDLARRHRHLVALCVFVLVIGGIYLSVLLGHRSLVTNGAIPPGPLFVGDPLAGGAISYPLERVGSIGWAHFHYPILDPYQGYGIPLLPNQGVPVYPLQTIADLIFPHNYSIWNVVNLVALAFGCYLLASSFRQSFFGAMAVGMAAALAGVAPPNINMSMLNPLAVLPFILLAINYSVDPTCRRRKAALLATATTFALLCLSGFQEVLPLFAIVIVVYAVAMLWHHQTLTVRPGLLVSTAVAGVVGVLVGLVGLLPTLAAVQAHEGVNGTNSYAFHAPPSWLATLTIPQVNGQGLGSPPGFGQTAWALGTPVLVPVLCLALILIIRRRGRGLGWYVWPSLGLVTYGLLGFADIFHVLTVMDLPIVDSIESVRFLQFAWWIPWCLLLGAVITGVRVFRWFDIAAALIVTGLVDLVLVLRYRHALSANDASTYLHQTKDAAIDAAIVVGAFLLVAGIARWATPTVVGAAMAVVVGVSCIFYLPTNFYGASAQDQSLSLHAVKAAQSLGSQLALFDTSALSLPLPATTYDAQIWGAVMPTSYWDVVDALFSTSETRGVGPVPLGIASLALATVNPRFISVIRSLGVNILVTDASLSATAGGAIARCPATSTIGTSSAQVTSTSPALASTTQSRLCYVGRTSSFSGLTTPMGFEYVIGGASPLVEPGIAPVAVPSNQVGLQRLLRRLSPTVTALPRDAYITSSARHLVAARGVVATGRSATTASVSTTLRAATPGLVVLRETYMAGMRASVNGRNVGALPVDGGLWTAVPVGAGRSRVVLDYVSFSDQAEFALAIIGLLAMVFAWLALAVVTLRRARRGRAAGAPASVGGS